MCYPGREKLYSNTWQNNIKWFLSYLPLLTIIYQKYTKYKPESI